MKKANIITSLVLLVMSVYIVIMSYGYGYHDEEGLPAAGFVPLWTGAMIGLLSLIMLYSNTIGNRPDSNKTKVFDKRFYKNLLVLLGSSIVAMLLVPVIGMLAAIGLLTGYISWALGTKNMKMNIALMVLTPVAFWLVFSKLLEIQFPAGIFGF